MKQDLAEQVALEIISLREKLGLTQKGLADRMGTKQSAIARAEDGKHLPTLSFLEKMGKSVGARLRVEMPDLKTNKQQRV